MSRGEGLKEILMCVSASRVHHLGRISGRLGGDLMLLLPLKIDMGREDFEGWGFGRKLMCFYLCQKVKDEGQELNSFFFFNYSSLFTN